MSHGNGLEEGDCPLGLPVLCIAMGEPAVLDTPSSSPFILIHPGKAHPFLLCAMCRAWQCTRSGMSQSPGHSGC